MWSSLIGGRYCCHVSSGRAGLLSLMAPYVNVDITVSRPPQPAVAAFHRRCITGENLLPRIYRSRIWCGVNSIMARVRFKLTSFCPWTVNMKIQGSKKYILILILICYCFAVESKNIITNAMQHRLVFLVGVWTRVVIYHSPLFPSFSLGLRPHWSWCSTWTNRWRYQCPPEGGSRPAPENNACNSSKNWKTAVCDVIKKDGVPSGSCRRRRSETEPARNGGMRWNHWEENLRNRGTSLSVREVDKWTWTFSSR